MLSQALALAKLQKQFEACLRPSAKIVYILLCAAEPEKPMVYDEDTLNRVYDRTDGYCHICGKKLSFVNYGLYGNRGAWEVEHSRAKAKGGTSHRNNLYPACIPCNRTKCTVSSRTARSWNGRTKAPLSRERKKQLRATNTIAGAFWGGLLGAFAGPGGMITGALIGGVIGGNDVTDK